ncbi:MAG TPA: arginine--tRNA ligase, partial [Acidimicrobiales bacterium]|nr:arginine--tRNA ligase [Acidimicrobiales bacterium]
TNRQGDPLPLIVRKSDEGYGYGATDLAAIADRVRRLAADRVLYVVGAPQAQHFAMCFATAALAGWVKDPGVLVHVAFGSVLDAERKMFRTRAGDTVKLADLLDEAVARAEAAVAQRDPDLPEADRTAVARMLGIGAVKFADLSTDRVKDYVFDWDRMLAFEGSTGPYLQYAHARIRSIFRRLDPGDEGAWAAAPVSLVEPAERALVLALLGFPDAVAATLEGWAPSRLCAYLYDLASAFTTFYETCPVLKAPTDDLRRSRLRLADLTARALAQGLALLGIAAPDQM